MEEEKQERKAKNELQRLRNIARQKKVKVPTVGVVTPSVKGSLSLICFQNVNLPMFIVNIS